MPISRALRVSGRAEETWSQSAMYSYNTFPIVAASAKGQRWLGPTVRKAVLGLFGFQTSLPDDPSILSISLTGLTRQPVLTAYTTSAPTTTTTILILREEIPSSGKRTRQETYPSSILRPSMASSSPALHPISLLLALLLLSAPSPSACASLSFLTASSNGSASTSADPELEDLAPEPTFLEEVIDAVSEKYDWDPDAEVRVWPLDAGAVRVGSVQRYEFRARAGGSAALARFSDEAVEWRLPSAPAVEEVDGPDGVDVVPAEGAFGFDTGVRDVELVGPVELKLAGNQDGSLVELQLPSVSGLTLTCRCSRFCIRSRSVACMLVFE